MQMTTKENVEPPESPINGLRCSDFGGNSDSLIMSALSGPCDQGKQYSLDDSESFYEKLHGIYESAGLNLVLNVRETLLNLHVFYKEVTERGGYYQVSKDKRWEEVSVAMKLGGIKVNFPQQLQRAYALFLYQFEQIYFYRAPEKVASRRAYAGQVSLLGNSSRKKRKSLEGKDFNFQSEAKKSKDGSNFLLTGGIMAERKLSPSTPSKAKETEKSPNNKYGRLKRIRTAYQIFIKRECERLRRCLGEKLIGQSYRFMADDAWRRLSETDRQPYIEESNKDREIVCQQMNALKELQGAEAPNAEENNGRVSNSDHARPEFEKPIQVSDQASVQLAVEITQNSNSNALAAETVLQNVLSS